MNKLVKNALKLISGSVAAQLISIMSIPIITRVFGAEQFGIFSMTLSIATILATIYLIGMHLAILIPKNDIEALAIVRFMLLVGAALSLACLLYVMIFFEYIVEIISIDLDYLELMSIPILAFSLMLSTLISFWGVRVKEYALTSKSKIIESVTERGGSILLGLMGYTSSLTLVVFKGGGSILATIYFLIFSRSKCLDLQVAANKWPIKEVYKKYKNYIYYNTPSSILTTFSLQVPLIMIGIFYSPLYAGFFAMANRVINIPSQTIGASISKLITQNVSEQWMVGRILATQKVEILYLSIFPLFLYPFILLAITGEKLTVLLLGDGWEVTGSVIQMLTCLALSNLLIQCFGGIFDIVDQQNKRLLYHMVNAVVRMLSIAVPAMLGVDFSNAVLIFAIAGSIMNFLALGVILSLVNCSIFSILKMWHVFMALALLLLTSRYLELMIKSDVLFVVTISLLTLMVFCLFSLKKVINLARK